MFAPLRIISEYSFLKSGLLVSKIGESIKKGGFSGAAISDLNVLYGIPSFIKEMDKISKKYLVGMEVIIDDTHLVLYATSENGYKNLIRLSLKASKEDIVLDDLKEHSGLIGIIETNHGKFKESFDPENKDFFKYLVSYFKSVDSFYLGLEINSREEFDYAQKIRSFAKENEYITIAFPRIRHQNKSDAITIKITEAIDTDEKLEIKNEDGEEYFHPLEFYSKIYTKKELDLTEELINSSKFDFYQKRGKIIHFPVEDSIETLKQNVFDGLKRLNINDEAHISRAKYELEVIVSMGYADYFLIVADYVNYARSNGILVGPGRGSAAGSLVSYALGITEVDPLKFDLQFERFLNKARKSMPDIDIDFMDTARDQMVEYMRTKYGNEHVANIATFQTIQAKQALRDIGRIYNIPSRHIDLLSKSITEKLSLREAYKTLPAFKKLIDSDKYFLEIVSLASKIEGLPRQAGLHAAGIIINQDPLYEVLPVTVDFDDHYTSQYEKDYLEEQGFLKMDFLSLTNLSAIDYCLKLIEKNKDVKLSFYDLPYDDKDSIELIKKGQTIGVFQLESSGMRNAIKIIKPKQFEDIVTLLSIFRPGPMDNIKDYQDRKEGKIKVEYMSESLKEILAPTYGVLIYQEQVNKIAQVMAGFTPEHADLFRRAISKKDRDKLASSKVDFVNGSIKNGYTQKQAEKMFNDILKFADYGFNKSHAVVYAMIACRMAYLKYHYPLEFYSAILTISGGTTDHKFSDYLAELKSRGYKVYPPNINKSTKHFEALEDGLLYPLNMIKGMTELVINKVLDNRLEKGEFTDFFNFASRMYGIDVSETNIAKFIDSGSLDSLCESRATMRATLHYAYQLAELSYDNNGQLILDATLENQKQFFKDVDIPLVNLNLEYEALGIMLSDNPLKYKKDLLDANNVISLNEAKEANRNVTICGLISNVKTIKVRKNNTTMAFVKIFDESDEMEVTVFPRIYQNVFQLLSKNEIILVKGHYEHRDEKESFIADDIKKLEE